MPPTEQPTDPGDCGALHPLAGVLCQLPGGHLGPHKHQTGVMLRWYDQPDDKDTSDA